MKILALNCGSSSLKYQLYDWKYKRVDCLGVVEKIGLDEPSLKHRNLDKSCTLKDSTLTTHANALTLVVNMLLDGIYGEINSMSEIYAVGHRVVHGGDRFTRSTRITDTALDLLGKISVLAPLHNPPNLAGIRAAKSIMPNALQVAVFDTAFHQSMPEVAYQYAIPRKWYNDHHVRRYGFHGTSHLYVSKRAAVMLGKPAKECNLIIMHIGNGVSVTAIKNGVSVDTSMGFTPLEGAIMGTRSGDLDPAIPLYMQQQLGTTADAISAALNRESGLLGITDKYVDRRDILQCAEKGDEQCKLAVDMEIYRLKKYFGMYAATLGRVDAVVFTAGVGENSGIIRQGVMEGLEHFGVFLDRELNLATVSSSGETMISTEESPVKVFMIPTNEELVLIEDVVGVLDGTYDDHMHYKYSFA
ncbi:MAG: acetate kinase [Deferribacteraceae bacterium]|jgi:acetate kinase|nr:acetate kinase [Deferribacteraceae bacterium]